MEQKHLDPILKNTFLTQFLFVFRLTKSAGLTLNLEFSNKYTNAHTDFVSNF
jgi:hypothetical protein